jgi:S1-C subfamily serine protease
MEKHKNIIYTLILLLVIFQSISFIFVSIQFSRLNSKIDYEIGQTEKDLTKHFTDIISLYDSENQRNFNDLSLAITKQAVQQESFEEQIDIIRTSPSQEDFSAIVEDAVKSVVAVMTESSVGSGFIVSYDGYVVTNYHVIQKAGSIRVLTYDKRVIPATIVGFDKLRDLAVLKIQGQYDYLKLADSNKLQVGRKVIAIGNPLGLSFTVTEGIISGLDREGPNGIQEYIQTDVSLNPGNSGGPLIDTQEKVIGINNFKIGGAESLGFALESNSITKSVNAIAGKILIE